ncbi:MAG: TolC family protein [bacterium]|nr:TolC family protein [bacterium]
MMWFKLLIVALAISGLVPVASGQTGPQDEVNAILNQSEISLDDLFRLAELTNPQLGIDRARISARLGQAVQAGLYPNPELTFGIGEAFLVDPNPYKMRVELMQPLVLGGRLGLAREAANFQAESAQYELLQSRREIYGQIHKLWADQLYFQEVEVTFGVLMNRAQQTLQLAKARFDSRSEPESHVTKAMLEVYDLEVSLQQLRGQRVLSNSETIALLGGLNLPLDRVSGSLVNNEGKHTWGLDHLEKVANHPAVLRARMGVAAADAEARVAGAERFPDLGVFLAFGQARPEDDNFVEGGISIPVPLFNRNQGRLAETKSLKVMVEHEARQVENEWKVALITAKQNHDLLHEQLETLETTILPAAERGLNQAQQAYGVGRLMFLELVDAQRTYANIRLRALQIQRDLAMAEADRMSLLGLGPYAQTGGIQ